MFTLNATVVICGIADTKDYVGTGANIAFDLLSDLIDADFVSVRRKDLPDDPNFQLALRHKLLKQPKFVVVD